MEEEALARALTALRPSLPHREGPLVSIVVTNLSGEGHLRRLLYGLNERTRYAEIEVVLVDNGSTDASLLVFEEWTGTKHLVVNSQNLSFSAANNLGIRRAEGELVLLANNDIDPIHPDWLGFMVESLADGIAAVGAMLVYPTRQAREVPPTHQDLTIQHLGVSFEYSRWGVRAANLGSGQDPLSITSPGRREVPAVTAACLLARRADLLATPLDEEYWYGSEDWDLCLRLGAIGSIVVDERAVLFHHEYGTQERHMSEAWFEQRARNHQWFNDLWGPALMRKLRAEATGAEPRFFRSDSPPRLCVPPAAETKRADRFARRVRRQARELGWKTTANLAQTCEIAIATAPPANVERFSEIDLTVAVVVDREEEWAATGSLDAAKRVLVPDATAKARLEAVWATGVPEIVESGEGLGAHVFARLLEAATPRPDVMRIGVSTCAPDWERAQFWGDTHLARGLMRAFRRLGHETTELIAPWKRNAASSSCDVILHLRGLSRRPVARGQWNLLWIISHPDLLEPGECDDYDLVASASRRHAEELSAELGRPVHFIPQATDADSFALGPFNVDYQTSVIYVGNARWPNRRAPRWLMRNGQPFDLYGRNWDGFPEAAFVRSEYIPNQDLAAAYRSAGVVVADHHGSMRTNGFVANRLFDVLASGGVVLSDDVAGVSEIFGDLVPTYSNAGELDAQLRSLLADPARRRRLAAEGHQLVMAGHTLDHRARTWLEALDQL